MTINNIVFKNVCFERRLDPIEFARHKPLQVVGV